MNNPLIPIMLERLPSYKISEPLTTEESARFYQLITYVDGKVFENAYPKSFMMLFPDNTRDAARKAYMQTDV